MFFFVRQTLGRLESTNGRCVTSYFTDTTVIFIVCRLTLLISFVGFGEMLDHPLHFSLFCPICSFRVGIHFVFKYVDWKVKIVSKVYSSNVNWNNVNALYGNIVDWLMNIMMDD